MHVVREARFASAFTFQYSKRPGTPAAEMDDQVPREVVQERYERLVDAGQRHLLAGEPRRRPAASLDVLIAEGEGRKDDRTERLSRAGRPTTGSCTWRSIPRSACPRPGDVVTAEITYAAPHHLVADRVARRCGARAAGDAAERRARAAPRRACCSACPTVRADS